jgi:predicted ATP-dependent endonuclease of OLD family
MKLTGMTIHKYKSFVTDQEIAFEPDVTCVVGKNESGKSAVLECLAKFNYFDEDDDRFKFDQTFDYPKNEWKSVDDPLKTNVVTLSFELESEEQKQIETLLGPGVSNLKKFSITRRYDGHSTYHGIEASEAKFISNLTRTTDLPEESLDAIKKISTLLELKTQVTAIKPDSKILAEITRIEKGAYAWPNILNGYIAKSIIDVAMPVFWYFDDFLSLPGRIDLTKTAIDQFDTVFTEDNLKISKALIELSKIDITDLVKAPNFEAYISELEATSNAITDELFEYWKTNQHLEIKFDIETVAEPGNPGIQYQRRFLNVRIRNNKHRVSLPLGNRSKGFVWFFSFLVWFSKIQADHSKKYILLLDEPGLNLHASAQADLLRYVNEKLQSKYQVVYTTHSPFMIETSNIHRVRTVYDTLDAKNGSVVSDSIQEKDPDTLFPLQAALGYDIAQNLFISTNNLLVEGPGDLVYFEVLNDLLIQAKKECLRSDVTIVPVGGLDKVSSFISLLRGQKLNIACILDTYTDQKGKRRLDDLIVQKIIKDKNVLFFDEFTTQAGKIADIEDMFTEDEYLKIYNSAFSSTLDKSNIAGTNGPITRRIASFLGVPRYNHYLPAVALMRSNYDASTLSIETLERFEKLFNRLNQLF